MKISVILPTFNRDKWIARAIKSFLAQDYENKELIVLNNGSTDNTATILKQFEECPNIRIYTREKNNVRSLNTLWDLVSDGLICQLHDDDELTLGSLSLRARMFELDPTLNVVYGAVNQQDATGNKIGFSPALPPDYQRLLSHDYINFTTLMWRQYLGFKFDEELEFNYDWLFKIRCLKECKVGFIKDAVMNYTLHEGQETHRNRRTGAHEREVVLMGEKLKALYGA